jgi:hypothetical protein
MANASQPRILCIRVTGQEEAVRALLAGHAAEAYAVKRDGGLVSAEIFLPEPAVERIDRGQLQVEVLYDATARGRQRQREVGRGNRFEGERKTFEGLGAKTKEGPR